jgi:hypothetical protein
VFANATAVGGPGLVVPHGAAPLLLFPRLAGIVGAEAKLAGYSLLAEWRMEAGSPPKDRDFAIGLGPVVSTPDELDPTRAEIVVRSGGNEHARFAVPAFDWEAATAFAAAGTVLRPGDVLVGPSADPIAGLAGAVELEAAGIGVLLQTVA